MYLLDTDTCISVLKNRDTTVRRFSSEGPQTIFVSVISYHELLYGALHSGAVERHLRLVANFVAPLVVLPFTAESALHSSRIKEELSACGKRIGSLDTLIAGHAREHGLTVVTGNRREFERVGNLDVETW